MIIFSSYGRIPSLEDHLTTFKEIVCDLETMEVNNDEEDLGLILLCSLPPSYSNFKDPILYSCETLTLDEIYDALFSKEKIKHLMVRSEAQAEGLVVKGRTHKKDFGGVVGDKTCNYYKKKGHIISECYKLQNKNKRASEQKGKQS